MSEIKLTADSGGGTTSLKAPSSTTSNADVVLKLPVADGSANQVLKTDGSGQLSFTSNAGTTINNNADNKIITGSGTANTLEAESLAYVASDGDLWIGHAPTTHYDNRKMFIHQPTAGETAYLSITGEEGAGIVFGDSVGQNTGNYESLIWHNNSDDSLKIATDNGNKGIKIENGGDVEVIDGNVKFASGHGIEFQNSVTVKEGSSNLNINIGAGNNNIEFLSGGTAFLKLRGTNGNAEFVNGNVEIGTAGKGIHFHNYGTGTDVDSNLLDDYEEGTWTPTSNVGTIQVHNASYIKIGNLITYRAYISFPSMSGVSNVEIQGWPFQSSGSDYHTCPVNSNANLGANLVGQYYENTGSADFMNFAKDNNVKATVNEMSGCFIIFVLSVIATT